MNLNDPAIVPNGWGFFLIAWITCRLMGVLFAIHSVWRQNRPQSALGWAMALVTLPVLAIPAYLILNGSSKFRSYTHLLRASNGEINHQFIKDFEGLTHLEKHKIEELGLGTLRNVVHLPITAGNKCKLLVNGRETYSCIFDMISRAKKYILLEYFAVANDSLGIALANRLLAAADTGVKVYFIRDEIGSLGLKGRFHRALNDHPNIIFKEFGTTRKANVFQINFRNHRKLVIVDGIEAATGGLNATREYIVDEWRDTHMWITGPAVAPLQICFIEDFFWATDAAVPELNWQYDPRREPRTKLKGVIANCEILSIPSSPADGLPTNNIYFSQMIYAAKKRIWMTAPYFFPSESVQTALTVAAIRGVDVRIIIPRKSDNQLTNLSAWAVFPRMIQAGVQIYLYREIMVHQKVFLVDDELSSIGSANLDNRSIFLMFELCQAVVNKAFNREVEAMLINDMKSCDLITLHDIDSLSRWKTFFVHLATLWGPIL